MGRGGFGEAGWEAGGIGGGEAISGGVEREGGGETYVYAFVGETRRDGGALFFGFGEEHGELLDGGHGDVAAVVAGEEGLKRPSVSEWLCLNVRLKENKG